MLWLLTLVFSPIAPIRAQTAESNRGSAGTLAGPYIDPRQLTSLTWPAQSHWLQPWRAYLETVPANTFVNGLGVNLADENPALVVQMLANYGIRTARIEINWGALDYQDETKLTPWALPTLLAQLQACKQRGIRPLILLNSHHGNPTPFLTFQRTTTAAAAKGATQIQLNDTSNLIIGRSGLSHLTDYWAAEALITAINGKTITLSKPLPEALTAGQVLEMATLKYRPFAAPNTADYRETMAAWQRYVTTVATFVANTLGTTTKPDKGFDLEIWNELTFGTHFLYLSDYYTPYPYDHPAEPIWDALVRATAAVATANPSKFQGVTLIDGFSNTTPWRAADQEPARVTGLSKHPYHTLSTYPGDAAGEWLNAVGAPASYQPTYTARFFPEYFGSALAHDTFIRDMAPITTRYVDIFGQEHAHGRNARTTGGPVNSWITEVGIAPRELGIVDRTRALALKAKANTRFFAFYLNKGVNKVFLYSTSGNQDENGARQSDLDFGLLQDNFLDYVSRPNAVYPLDDSSYTSPSLKAISRMVAKMQTRLDPALTATRALRVESISDSHNHFQFAGDGTAAHPTLYNRDLFAFLPFQVNANRFVIPYYVMTRDLTTDLTPETFTLQLSGFKGASALVTAYDPINNSNVPVTVLNRTAQAITLKVTATDYPYLLLVDEPQRGLQGIYYDNLNFTNPKVTRIDPTIDFTWGGGAPTTALGADTFSVRWSGFVQPRYTESYTFYTLSDDGVRLTVNGQRIIDNWTDHAVAEDRGTINLVAGQKYAIQLDFYENTEDAVIQLLWSSRSQAREKIPASQLSAQTTLANTVAEVDLPTFDQETLMLDEVLVEPFDLTTLPSDTEEVDDPSDPAYRQLLPIVNRE